MSRIGKKPVALPAGVKVDVQGRDVIVEAGKNKLKFTHRPEVSVKVDTGAKAVVVERVGGDERTAKAMHGLTRAMIANMVEGVTKGFSKELEVTGVGWTAKLEGQAVALTIGYADMRKVEFPKDVKVEIAGTKIKVSGADKQAVGEVAAKIRAQRPPEPYNGKGIKYADEKIIRKQGKAFGSSA